MLIRISLIFILIIGVHSCLAQKTRTNVYDSIVISKKMLPRASGLLLADSLALQKDILSDSKLIEFINKNEDSLYSFVCSFNILLYEDGLSLKHEAMRNEFDSIALEFVYNKFLNYNIKNGKRNKIYRLFFSISFIGDEKLIHVGVKEIYTSMFYSNEFYFKDFFLK